MQEAQSSDYGTVENWSWRRCSCWLRQIVPNRYNTVANGSVTTCWQLDLHVL